MLLANVIAGTMFALGCGLLTAILLRRSYRYFGRGRKKDNRPIVAQPRPTDQWSGAYQDADARFERQKVELHDQARELKAQLDSKMAVLQQLCAESQQQIDRLEALLQESRQVSASRS